MILKMCLLGEKGPGWGGVGGGGEGEVGLRPSPLPLKIRVSHKSNLCQRMSTFFEAAVQYLREFRVFEFGKKVPNDYFYDKALHS